MNSAAAADAAAASMDNYRGVHIGNVIDCEGGSVITDSYFTARAVDRDGKVIKEFKGEDRHMQNFIDVIRSRKTADLYGPIGEGHVSSALCHLGNISHRTGAATTPEALKDRIKNDWPLRDAVGRMEEHLGRQPGGPREDSRHPRCPPAGRFRGRALHRRRLRSRQRDAHPLLPRPLHRPEARLVPTKGEPTGLRDGLPGEQVTSCLRRV